VAVDAGSGETRPNRDPFVIGSAVDLFDHPGLFMVGLERPSAMPAVARTLAPGRRRGRGRVAPTTRPMGGLHRYCSGCANETEHVVWTPHGPGSIPSIRWPAAEAAIGTTICVNCGQWRAASSQPRLSAWSSWPRTLIGKRLAVTVDSADAADDWVSETRAENEGMPPRREAPRTRRGARLRRVPAASPR
jgi:hypothetical protein